MKTRQTMSALARPYHLSMRWIGLNFCRLYWLERFVLFLRSSFLGYDNSENSSPFVGCGCHCQSKFFDSSQHRRLLGWQFISHRSPVSSNWNLRLCSGHLSSCVLDHTLPGIVSSTSSTFYITPPPFPLQLAKSCQTCFQLHWLSSLFPPQSRISSKSLTSSRMHFQRQNYFLVLNLSFWQWMLTSTPVTWCLCASQVPHARYP